MPLVSPPPPVIVAPAGQHQPQPLKFLGFRVGMPFPTAQALIKTSGGKLNCAPAPGHAGLDCSGTLPYPGLSTALEVRIGSVSDSVTLVMLTARAIERVAPAWASALREDYGPPKDDLRPGVQESWQWSRGSQMLRIVERRGGKDEIESSLTLGSAPLPELPPSRAPASPR